MSLPEPAARQHLHTRAVTYRGYLRDDGLWDIEGEMADTKAYASQLAERGHLEPGEPIHGMAIRVTVDEDMTIREIASDMAHTPFGECLQGEDPMQRMVGARMGPGWRQAIEKNLGGVRGCTHMRELLFNMATAAYQTVYPYRERERKLRGEKPSEFREPPYHLGRCIGWDFSGPLVLRYFPQFAGRDPKKPQRSTA